MQILEIYDGYIEASSWKFPNGFRNAQLHLPVVVVLKYDIYDFTLSIATYNSSSLDKDHMLFDADEVNVLSFYLVDSCNVHVTTLSF